MTTELVARPPIHPPSFDRLDPSRFDHVYLYYEGEGEDDVHKQRYRYRLAVVDRSILPTTSGILYPTVAFLIPAGRESEYLFSSHGGLSSVVAKSAKCVRLIAVAFGRHATFADQASVQSELTAAVQVLSRQAKFLPPPLKRKLADAAATIPFMVTDGIGSRNVLATGITDLSGGYLVEQTMVQNLTVRRLYFMDNPFVIQSEVTMLHRHDDDNHEGKTESVDKSRLSFAYHKAIVSGILVLATSLRTAPTSSSGCIVGLGGGGLVIFLNHVLPLLKLTVAELDPSIVSIARTHFGLETSGVPDRGCHVAVGNGLHIGALLPNGRDEQYEQADNNLRFPPKSLSFVVIDVDSKDKTVGMSCPPVEFGTVEYLQQLKDVLKPTGSVLAMNISARDPEKSKAIFRNAQNVFGAVFVSAYGNRDGNGDVDETKAVNVSLLATPDKAVLPGGTDDVFSRLEETISKERVHEEVWEDLGSCERHEWADMIDGIAATQTAATGKNSHANTTNMKNNRYKKKGNKKGKKR
jgi:hypothetical protein